MPAEASCRCGWKGHPRKDLPGICPSCHEWLFCPLGCGKEGEEHGRHFYHEGPCSYHYGPCDTPVWCECPGVKGQEEEEKAVDAGLRAFYGEDLQDPPEMPEADEDDPKDESLPASAS